MRGGRGGRGRKKLQKKMLDTMPSREGNLWLTASPLFSLQIMFMEKIGFFILFSLHIVVFCVCLFFFFNWSSFITTVIVKEIGQNNFIYEMRKTYFSE